MGHKDPEVTNLYLNDRGLSAGEWKRVEKAIPTEPLSAPKRSNHATHL
jgi:hypothetical protein